MLAIPLIPKITVLPVPTPPHLEPEITSQYVPGGKHVWNTWVVYLSSRCFLKIKILQLKPKSEKNLTSTVT